MPRLYERAGCLTAKTRISGPGRQGVGRATGAGGAAVRLRGYPSPVPWICRAQKIWLRAAGYIYIAALYSWVACSALVSAGAGRVQEADSVGHESAGDVARCAGAIACTRRSGVAITWPPRVRSCIAARSQNPRVGVVDEPPSTCCCAIATAADSSAAG
jgi:hypothetical protein